MSWAWRQRACSGSGETPSMGSSSSTPAPFGCAVSLQGVRASSVAVFKALHLLALTEHSVRLPPLQSTFTAATIKALCHAVTANGQNMPGPCEPEQARAHVAHTAACAGPSAKQATQCACVRGRSGPLRRTTSCRRTPAPRPGRPRHAPGCAGTPARGRGEAVRGAAPV